MSGLLLRSPMTAGPDGVRDASSKQGGGFERATGSHGVSRVLGSIDHAICSVSSKLSGLRCGDAYPLLKTVMDCMRQVGLDGMSTGCVSLFGRVPCLRPYCDRGGAPRTAAVKAGRRALGATCCGTSRPRLDGGEHGASLAGLG